MPAVDFIYDDECPNVEAARAHLRKAFAACRLPAKWEEHRIGDPAVPQRARGFGSPTIIVNGKDVAGAEPEAEQCCRIYATGGGVPTVEVIATALEDATKNGPPSGGSGSRWRSSVAVLPGIGAALLPNVACPACWPAYAGVLSSLGLGFLIDGAWLLPITAAGLAVALGAFALRARRRRGYGPLFAGLVASTAVLVGKFGIGVDVLTYAGVGVLVAASIWNLWPRRVVKQDCPTCAIA